MNKSDIPILIFKREDGLSPLDITIKYNNVKCTQMILDIMERFQDNTVFNFLIEPYTTKLIEMGINLKEYLESQMTFA